MQIKTHLLIGLTSLVSINVVANEKKTIEPQQFLTFPSDKTASLVFECAESLWEHDEDTGVTTFTLTPEKNRKRCEFAIQGLLQRDVRFRLSFEFKVNEVYDDPVNWHSYFQFHSFPDEGEQWRCPVSALESRGGTLRMFNRWDEQHISSTINGTCANDGNSIQARTLFSERTFNVGSWNEFTVEGVMSTNDEGHIRVSLNDELLSEVVGPNTFNDDREPYFKLGIYKPTRWAENDHIALSVRNVEFE